jgi:tRNA (cytidine32/uridine32-2'-O)-methyltransferase
MPLDLSLSELLSQVQVVLVETTLSANIGSSARALKTMGFSNLSVVNPRQPIAKQAQAMAAGATDLLESVTLYQDLRQATEHAQLVVGLSGRSRTLGQISLELTDAARQLSRTLMLSLEAPPKISLVFGREDRGLTNEELALCDWLVHIEASEDYGVLNLSQAVQVSCYALRRALTEALSVSGLPKKQTDQSNVTESSGSDTPAYLIDAGADQLYTPLRTQWDEPAARSDQHEQLAKLSLQLLTQLELYDPNHPRKTEFRLNRLAKRLQLDRSEYNLIRSALARLVD